jgi:hypothetical protein
LNGRCSRDSREHIGIGYDHHPVRGATSGGVFGDKVVRVLSVVF